MVRKPALCPFCGEALRYVERRSRRFERVVYRAWEHPAVGCLLDGMDFGNSEIKKWNCRCGIADRAVQIAAIVMREAGLCRFEDETYCHSQKRQSVLGCQICIEKWLLDRARTEVRQLCGEM